MNYTSQPPTTVETTLLLLCNRTHAHTLHIHITTGHKYISTKKWKLKKRRKEKIQKLKKEKDFTVLLATSQIQELICNLQTQACEPLSDIQQQCRTFICCHATSIHLRTTSLWHYYAYKIQKSMKRKKKRRKEENYKRKKKKSTSLHIKHCTSLTLQCISSTNTALHWHFTAYQALHFHWHFTAYQALHFTKR